MVAMIFTEYKNTKAVETVKTWMGKFWCLGVAETAKFEKNILSLTINKTIRIKQSYCVF